MTEQIRNINNTRLLSVDESIRDQVIMCLDRMHELEQPAVIHRDVWRSPALQELKFRQGVSKLKWGYHCATRNGKPASLACDIVHIDHAWFSKFDATYKADEYFWLCLGRSAKEAGLDWGGEWMWNWPSKEATEKVRKLNERIDTLDATGLETARDFGWDVAHIEVRGVSAEEAAQGWRISNGVKFKIVP